MAELDEGPKILMDKISKIDKIEERQHFHAKEIEQIKSVLSSNELDGRLTKVEKRQEFVLDEIKEYRKDFREMKDDCNKQRSQCMGNMAPLSIVADIKTDIKRLEERLFSAYTGTKTELTAQYETSAKWTRWAFTISMLACMISTVSVLVCLQIFQHLPKG